MLKPDHTYLFLSVPVFKMGIILHCPCVVRSVQIASGSTQKTNSIIIKGSIFLDHKLKRWGTKGIQLEMERVCS